MKRAIIISSLAICLGLFARVFVGAHDPDGAVLRAYEKIRAALADDNLVAAKQAATSLKKKADAAMSDTLARSAAGLAGSADLNIARKHFKMVSQEAILLVKGKPGYYVATCPMARASWVQKNKTLQNPYMGKGMLHCGTLQEASGLPKETPHHCGS